MGQRQSEAAGAKPALFTKNLSASDRQALFALMQQAVTAHQKGDFRTAEGLYRRVLSKDPYHADANQFLGVLAHKAGQLQAALQLVGNAVAVDPKRFQAYFILGSIHEGMQQLPQAEACYQRCIEVNPGFVEAYNNLGVIHKKNHRYEAAIACFRKVVEKNARSGFALGNLGNVLKESGRMREAVEVLAAAVKAEPGLSAAYSNLLLALNYLSDIPPNEVSAKHRAWQRHCSPAIKANRFQHPLAKLSSDKKRLRVGYISPDFHQHSVAYFLLPLFQHHDKSKIEVFGYYNNTIEDAFTAELKACCDKWISVAAVPDKQLAEQIRHDEIDILVDLTGHMADNRLSVFLQKPAPVQASWLGYPNTTGLAQIDYRIVDSHSDPEGVADTLCSERLIRLKDSFLCYQGDDQLPEPSEAPALKNGFVTFGSFNNVVKMTPEVVEVWSEILIRSPDSRLLLKSSQLQDESTKARVIEMFEQEGIPKERLVIYGLVPDSRQHMLTYNEVDIALDPFPYNGTTTTFEALWMGVPTLTLSGDVHASRVGRSILTNSGLEGWIAENKTEYIERALQKAANPVELDALRKSLRADLRASPVCDAKGFAAQMESAYRAMWGSQFQTLSKQG